MKKINVYFSFMVLAIFALGACTSSSSDDMSNSDLGEVLSGGDNWVVSYFWDKTKEETHKFSGYTFNFKSGGVFEAINASGVVKGTWSISSSSQKLIINISPIGVLDELSDDWIILEKTNKLIKLKDDNDEHLEELHFKLQ